MHSVPVHSGVNSGMALFRRNKLSESPEWQIWLGGLPNIIPPESGNSSGFRQESVGQGKDLHPYPDLLCILAVLPVDPFFFLSLFLFFLLFFWLFMGDEGVTMFKRGHMEYQALPAPPTRLLVLYIYTT